MDDCVHGQPKEIRTGCRSRDAAPLGAAGKTSTHRNQIRLRHGAVRRMHGASGWRSGAVVCDAVVPRGGQGGRDHRRADAGIFPAVAAGVDRRGRSAVRVLRVRPDHGSRHPAAREFKSQRCGHRRLHDRKHLSLRNVSAHPPRDSPGGEDEYEGGAPVKTIVKLGRRDFLKTSALAGGGLILGVHLPGLARAAEASQQGASPFPLNAFVRIGQDDTVTVIVNHSEMGQGPYTSIPMMVAEELDADWNKVRYEAAPVAPEYNHSVYGIQMTGGSTSTWSEWERVRKAGAAARQMLLAAAGETWGVSADTCRTENNQVIHGGSGRKLSYGELAEKASRLTPPQNPPLKDPKKFKLVGKPTRRLDTPEKTNGKAIFGLDVNVPGMVVAVIARPPVFGAKLKSFNAEKAKAIPGVQRVVEIERGVAVVADGFWPAKHGREALEIIWDEGPLASLDSRTQREQYAELARKAGTLALKQGDVATALGGAAKRFEAIYDLPYLAHATMEPMNCVADVRADSAEVWTGTQYQTGDRDAIVKDTGLKPEQVKLHTMLCGGGFGRRAVIDSHFVREAVQVSKAIQKPVKVVWTREDDMRGGFYRPRAFHSISAGLGADGNPLAS